MHADPGAHFSLQPAASSGLDVTVATKRKKTVSIIVATMLLCFKHELYADLWLNKSLSAAFETFHGSDAYARSIQ